MNHQPMVSIVVPVYNQPEELRSCLAALAEQTYPSDRFEVIVVDNGSDLLLDELCSSFPFVRLLREPSPGSYRARNTGLKDAKADVLGFTDADCVPAPTWVERGAMISTTPEVGIIGGHVDLTYSRGEPVSAAEVYESVLGFRQADAIKQGFSVTANLFTRRDVFDHIGLFDEALMSNGDVEWGMRVRKQYQLVYDPALIVRHPARVSVRQVLRKRRRVAGGVFVRRRVSHSSRAWYVLWLLRPPLRASVRIIRSRHPIRRRASATALLLLTRVVIVAENLRLALGGRPLRA